MITLEPGREEGGRQPTRWYSRSAYLPGGKPAAGNREQQAARELEGANKQCVAVAHGDPRQPCRPALATAELRPALPLPAPAHSRRPNCGDTNPSQRAACAKLA